MTASRRQTAMSMRAVPLASRRVTIFRATPLSIGGQPVLFPSYFE